MTVQPTDAAPSYPSQPQAQYPWYPYAPGYYPSPYGQMKPPTSWNWLVVAGGVLALAVFAMTAFVSLFLAAIDPARFTSYDSIRGIYMLQGFGEMVAGIGVLIAFVGLARK